MRVPVALAVALVLTAAAAPAQAQDVDPVALVKTITSDTVRVVASIDGPDKGTLLPLCGSSTEPEPNSTIVGTIKNGCFQPIGSCEAFIVTVNPDHTPPKVNANPNWMCIEDTVGDLVNGPGAHVPLPVHLQVED